MKKRLTALLLVFCLTVPMAALAEGIADAEPAPVENAQEAETSAEEIPEIADAACEVQDAPEIADAQTDAVENTAVGSTVSATETENDAVTETPAAKSVSNIDLLKQLSGLSEEAITALLDKTVDEINAMSEEKLEYAKGLVNDATYVTGKFTGRCGSHLYYTLSGNTLKITGYGSMWNYKNRYAVPWYNSRLAITTVKLPGGITAIGDYAFFQCDKLTTVKLSKVQKIGYCAFAHCHSLQSVKLSAATAVDSYAFYCTKVTAVTLPKTIKRVGKCAFGYVQGSDGKAAHMEAFTVKGCCGTAAQTYAENNDCTFKTRGHYNVLPSKLTLKVGKTYSIYSNGNSEHAGYYNSGSKYASISSKGVITAKNPGTTYITFKWECGATTKMKVTVTE